MTQRVTVAVELVDLEGTAVTITGRLDLNEGNPLFWPTVVGQAVEQLRDDILRKVRRLTGAANGVPARRVRDTPQA